jgi:hypothetical protein
MPWHEPGTTSHATLHELEILELRSSREVAGAVSRSVLEIGDQEGRADLLALVRATGDGVPDSSSQAGALESVVQVMLLAERQKTLLDDGFRGEAAESLLRLVEQQLFVDRVRRVIDRARPGYVERVDRLASPRGVLSGPSLALSLLTGRPEVDCRFDEQTTDTVVLQIVLAGLRVVATDRVVPALTHLAQPVRSQAVALARRLATVTVLDSERALLASQRLVLRRLERPWADAFNGAVQVLSRRAVLPVDGTDVTNRAVGIHLSMEKWWEECLRDALRSIADRGTVHPQKPVPSPWAPVAGMVDLSRNADFVFELDGRGVLADAKYKLNESALSAQDGDQMFAYSHTATVSGTGLATDTAAVFRPQRVSENGRSRPRERDVLVRVTNPRYELRVLDLPFPTQDDVSSDTAWRGYLIALAEALGDGLGEIEAPAQPLAATAGS